MSGHFKSLRQNGKLLLLDAFIVVMSWGSYYRGGINADTLLYADEPEGTLYAWRTSGRYLGWLLNTILYQGLGEKATAHFKELFAMFLLLLILGIFLVQMTFLPFFRQRSDTHSPFAGRAGKLAFVCATALPFVNVLFAEHFYFTECYLMFPFAYFFAALAGYLISRHRYGSGILCLAMIPMFYQTGSVMAAIFLAAWLVMEEKARLSVRLVLREILWIGITMGFAALDLLSTYALHSLGFLTYVEKPINHDYSYMPAFLAEQLQQFFSNSLQLMPNIYAPLIASCAAFVTLLFVMLHSKKYSSCITIVLLSVLYLFFGVIFSVLQGSRSFIPRVVHILYSGQAMLLMLALYFGAGAADPANAPTKWDVVQRRWYRLFCLVPVIYLVLQVFFLQVIIQNRYVSNALDRVNAEAVVRAIRSYESETGVTVTKFAHVGDDYAPPQYDQVYYKRDQINERVYSEGTWGLIQYTIGLDHPLQPVEMDPGIRVDHFMGHDWDHLDLEEQLVIEGDTAYLCVY